MNPSPLAKRIKKFYDKGIYTKDMVKVFYDNGDITYEEYVWIVGVE